MFLAVINRSTRIDNSTVQAIAASCAAQLKLHVAPIWSMVPAPVVFYARPDEVPTKADLLVVLDDPDQADALGYHDETPEGAPYARTFVSPVLDHGGTPLTGGLSVSSVASHEVCEWFGDQFVNLWVDDASGDEYALELCDPVEADSYELDGVAVSNFVTKRYFDVRAPKESQFDYLNKLTEPFSMTSGGYLLVRRAGRVTQRFGAEYPDWKKATKRFGAARTAKRLKTPAQD